MRVRAGYRTAIAMLMLLCLAGMACGRRGVSKASPVTTLGAANQENEFVSLASSGDWVAAVWASSSKAAGMNILTAVSRDGGRSFAEPVRVNAVERQANVSGEQPPRIALVRAQGAAPVIVVVWTAKGPDGTLLLTARSMDGGRSFGPSEPVAGTQAAGNRGWESMAIDANGRVYVTWLDHRETVMSAAGAHGPHQHGAAAQTADGVERAQRSQLFVTTVDGSVEPQSVARGVCYCCKTAMLVARDGTLYTAWRHVYEGNNRDIAFTLSRDGGRSFAPPVRVSADGWELDGCPENGPSLAGDHTGRVHVVWPTLVTGAQGETLQLFSASTADGRTFTPRVALPTAGAAYHPQLVSGSEGSLFAAWEEAASGMPRQIRLARARPDTAGSLRFQAVELGQDTAGTYPALTATPAGLFVAWTSHSAAGSTIALRQVPY